MTHSARRLEVLSDARESGSERLELVELGSLAPSQIVGVTDSTGKIIRQYQPRVDALQSHGQLQPIIVERTTKTILSGDDVYAVAKHLGWKSISVQFVTASNIHAERIKYLDKELRDA